MMKYECHNQGYNDGIDDDEQEDEEDVDNDDYCVRVCSHLADFGE